MTNDEVFSLKNKKLIPIDLNLILLALKVIQEKNYP
jgi:hypothetical protein